MANVTTNRKPSHGVLHVKCEGKTASWTKIGAAWARKDQGGLNLTLDVLPVESSGRLVIRIRKDKSEVTQGEAVY